MAGIETDISQLMHSRKKLAVATLILCAIPFAVGTAIVKFFGYSWETSILFGVIVISSSVAVIVPSLHSLPGIPKSFGQFVLAAILLTDILCLVLISFFFQGAETLTNLPFGLKFFLLIVSIPLLFSVMPEISRFMLKKELNEDVEYEKQLRYVIIILIATLAYFTLVGVHPLLSAFLAGLALSSIVLADKSKILYAKLHTIGYGLFIPVFYFVIGMQLNPRLMQYFNISNLIMIFIIFGMVFSKFGSGMLAGKVIRLPLKEQKIFGAMTIPQLTTTLAVTYTASTLGMIDSVLTSSIILLAIVSTFVGPLLVAYFTQDKTKG